MYVCSPSTLNNIIIIYVCLQYTVQVIWCILLKAYDEGIYQLNIYVCTYCIVMGGTNFGKSAFRVQNWHLCVRKFGPRTDSEFEGKKSRLFALSKRGKKAL